MKHLIFVARSLSVKDDSKLVEDIIDFIGNHLLMCGGGIETKELPKEWKDPKSWKKEDIEKFLDHHAYGLEVEGYFGDEEFYTVE